MEVLIPKELIEERVSELASDIIKYHEDPYFICILNGSIHFFSDLTRKVKKGRIDFLKVSSYEGTHSSGVVNESLWTSNDLSGKDIILVEDIIDSGNTINYIYSKIKSLGPKRLSICTLLFKPDKFNSELYNIKPDYVGFHISDEFVIGYGLDYNQDYRNLPDINILR